VQCSGGVLANLLASAGPATSVIESLASSIAAGLVIGGFVGGLHGFLLTRSRLQSEWQALRGSYLGGACGLALLAFDTVWKHFV
jgi:hypothetical protein